MKISKVPQVYVPYGPVGSSECRVWEDFADVGEGEVEFEFREWALRNAIQGNAPTMFVMERQPLQEQGYHFLPVVNGEVSDELMGSFEAPRIYRPAAAGEPGRKLEEFHAYLPSFTDVAEFRVLKEGSSACDHDFGLEKWGTVFITEVDRVMDESEGYQTNDAGTWHNTVVCTRCGRVHAHPQKG